MGSVVLLQEPVKKSDKKKKNSKKKASREKTSKKKSEQVPAEKKSAETIPVQRPAEKAKQPVKPVPVPAYDLFKGHELTVESLKPVIRPMRHEDWFPILTVFIVFLFSLINMFYQKKFKAFLLSLFKRSGSQAMRDENIFAQRLKVLLFLLFSLITASFFYQAGVIYNAKPPKLTGFQYFSVILFIVFFTYIGKILLVRLMGYIFKTEKENLDYTNNILLYLNILSFGLFPLVVMIAFTPDIQVEMLVKAGCVFILCALLFRIGRGYVMAVSNPLISKFYLFLYLCTLEILPLVVILKLFGDQFL